MANKICEMVQNQIKTARQSHSEGHHTPTNLYNVKMLYKTNLAKTQSNGRLVLINLWWNNHLDRKKNLSIASVLSMFFCQVSQFSDSYLTRYMNHWTYTKIVPAASTIQIESQGNKNVHQYNVINKSSSSPYMMGYRQN